MDRLPRSIALLLLNDVLSDGGAAGVLRRIPLEIHTVLIPVHNVWGAWFAWDACEGVWSWVSLGHEDW